MHFCLHTHARSVRHIIILCLHALYAEANYYMRMLAHTHAKNNSYINAKNDGYINAKTDGYINAKNDGYINAKNDGYINSHLCGDSKRAHCVCAIVCVCMRARMFTLTIHGIGGYINHGISGYINHGIGKLY
jgi:hypothetical protein